MKLPLITLSSPSREVFDLATIEHMIRAMPNNSMHLTTRGCLAVDGYEMIGGKDPSCRPLSLSMHLSHPARGALNNLTFCSTFRVILIHSSGGY